MAKFNVQITSIDHLTQEDPYEEYYLLDGKPFTGFATGKVVDDSFCMEFRNGIADGWFLKWNSEGILKEESYIEPYAPGGFCRRWHASGALQELSYIDFGVPYKKWEWDVDQNLKIPHDAWKDDLPSPLLQGSWDRYRKSFDQQALEHPPIPIHSLRSQGEFDSTFLYLNESPFSGWCLSISGEGQQIIQEMKDGRQHGWRVVLDDDHRRLLEQFHRPDEPGNFVRTWHPKGQLAMEQHSDFGIVVWEKHWDDMGNLTLQIEHLPGTAEWLLLEKRWAEYRRNRDIAIQFPYRDVR